MKNNIQEIIEHALKGGKFRFYDVDHTLNFDSKLDKIVIQNKELRYISTKGNNYEALEIEIIKSERRLKDPVSMMKTLVDGGWKPDSGGNFNREGEYSFTPRMWRDCGKEESKWFSEWAVDPSWVEEE